MNPYISLGSGIGTPEAVSLAERLAAWHDSMVAHERRLRFGRTGDVCDDECPHVEARTLWVEALAAFGDRAHELSFLRSRAKMLAEPNAVPPPSAGAERAENDLPPLRERKRVALDPRSRSVISPSLRSQRMAAEAEL